MQALILALLFATVTSSTQTGRLHVHTSAGLEILIDGYDVGKSNAIDGGLLIVNVLPGTHHVVIRTPDGREAAFNANVIAAQTTDVNVSPLGFRKLNRPDNEDDSAIVKVTSVPSDSFVEFNGVTRQNHDGTELTFENVPPGKYPMTVTQAGKSVRADIDVPKASVMTVNINFPSSTIRTTDTKPRPRRLQISEPNDALRLLNIPLQWKTAIRAVLPNTVSLQDAWTQGNEVRVRLRIPSADMADALLSSLERSSSFSRVAIATYPHREQSAWIVDFVFEFPGGR